MECDCCGVENIKLHKFYYGFFKTEYEPTKWCFVCERCQTKFQKASNIYFKNREPLITMEKQIKVRRKEKC